MVLPRLGGHLHVSTHRRRLFLLAVVLLLTVVVASSDALHAMVLSLVEAAEGLIERHPGWGVLVFVLLAALSAMLAFFSSVPIVPVGVYAWGEATCFVLLWSGWLLGGALSYLLGRILGRRIAGLFVSAEQLASYEEVITEHVSFFFVMLFQVALPSDLLGYVLGMARYRLVTYLAALGLADIPFALGAVYLGSSFLNRQYVLFVAIGLAGLALSAWVFYYLRARLPKKKSG